jgi:hypothetical protein
LVISYDRKAKVLKKSVAAFLSENENATAELLNRVIYVEYFSENKKQSRRTVTKYDKLNEREDAAIDYNNVFPIVCRNLAAFLGIDFDEEEENANNPFQRKNRYTKYHSKITAFYSKFLNTNDFRSIVSVSDKGFDAANPMQAGKTTPQSKQLIFGNNKTDVIPQRGVNNGPFRQPIYNNIQLFFITPKNHAQLTVNFADYLLNHYKNLFKGLAQYTGTVPHFANAQRFQYSIFRPA